MKKLRKITDYKNLENSLENIHDRVCFGKIAYLQCTEFIPTLNRLQNRFPVEYVSKKLVPDSPR